MAKNSSASKIVLNSFNDLFGMTDSENKVSEVRDVMIDELFEFKNHPFKVRDNAKMDELVESIKEHGVLIPGIARIRPSSISSDRCNAYMLPYRCIKQFFKFLLHKRY